MFIYKVADKFIGVSQIEKEGVKPITYFDVYSDMVEAQKAKPSKDYKKLADNYSLEDLKAYLIQRMDGYIIETKELSSEECEFYQEAGESFMRVTVENINETVALKDFYSFPYEELCKLSQARKVISKDLVASCLLRQSDKFMAIGKVLSKSYWSDIPCLVGDRTSLIILKEFKDLRGANYLAIVPYRKEMSWFYGCEQYGIIDYIVKKQWILVDKNEYLQKIESAKEAFKHEITKTREENRINVDDDRIAGSIPLSGYLDVLEDDIVYFISDAEMM